MMDFGCGPCVMGIRYACSAKIGQSSPLYLKTGCNLGRIGWSLLHTWILSHTSGDFSAVFPITVCYVSAYGSGFSYACLSFLWRATLIIRNSVQRHDMRRRGVHVMKDKAWLLARYNNDIGLVDTIIAQKRELQRNRKPSEPIYVMRNPDLPDSEAP